MTVKRMERTKTRRDKARELVAYLSYAVEDLRVVSPTSSQLLEMSIAAINEDVDLPHEPLPHGDRLSGAARRRCCYKYFRSASAASAGRRLRLKGATKRPSLSIR